MRTLGDVGSGQTLGRYELLAPIAQGGMAVIWAARLSGTRGFQKIVAVKSMLPILSSDPDFEEMFLREAALASKIRHPNVCEVLDLGEEQGVLYLVMEWIDGEQLNLIQKLARSEGGVPLPMATRVALQAALGLHAAHEVRDDTGELVGLVHRDVSPQNILIGFDGTVKVVDFGVAKATARAQGESTRGGKIKGKVPYMSPEQASGLPVDRRTDIFSLGIVLYQLITGKHPFRGECDSSTLDRICERVPVLPARSLNKDCPRELSAVVCKALAKDPSERFQSMLDFAVALERVLSTMTDRAPAHELGAFVARVLGERGKKRRDAIRAALKVADQRRGTEGRSVGPAPGQVSSLPAGEVTPAAPSAPVSAAAYTVWPKREHAASGSWRRSRSIQGAALALSALALVASTALVATRLAAVPNRALGSGVSRSVLAYAGQTASTKSDPPAPAASAVSPVSVLAGSVGSAISLPAASPPATSSATAPSSTASPAAASTAPPAAVTPAPKKIAPSPAGSGSRVPKVSEPGF